MTTRQDGILFHHPAHLEPYLSRSNQRWLRKLGISLVVFMPDNGRDPDVHTFDPVLLNRQQEIGR